MARRPARVCADGHGHEGRGSRRNFPADSRRRAKRCSGHVAATLNGVNARACNSPCGVCLVFAAGHFVVIRPSSWNVGDANAAPAVQRAAQPKWELCRRRARVALRFSMRTFAFLNARKKAYCVIFQPAKRALWLALSFKKGVNPRPDAPGSSIFRVRELRMNRGGVPPSSASRNGSHVFAP